MKYALLVFCFTLHASAAEPTKAEHKKNCEEGWKSSSRDYQKIFVGCMSMKPLSMDQSHQLSKRLEECRTKNRAGKSAVDDVVIQNELNHCKAAVAYEISTGKNAPK